MSLGVLTRKSLKIREVGNDNFNKIYSNSRIKCTGFVNNAVRTVTGHVVSHSNSFGSLFNFESVFSETKLLRIKMYILRNHLRS